MSSLERPDAAFDEGEADIRLSRDRRDIVAMLAKADNRMRAGDHRAANAYYGQVGKLAGDGRPIARSELLRARDATLWLAERFRQQIVDGLAARGVTRSTMHPRFAKSLSIMLGDQPRDPAYEQFPQLPNTYFYPDLPYSEFFLTEPVSWAKGVEEAAGSILAEAENLIANSSDFSPYVKRTAARPQGDVHGMLDDPSWSTLELTEQGEPSPERIALCPDTFDALDRLAPLCRIPNRAPSVMFSLLKAGAHIPPHTGMINARLICHLPLVVPGNGALRVGSKVRQWERGSLLVFDDTIEHEAWNRADSDRLVLIFDIWRPELEASEREQIAALFAVVDEY